MFCRGIITTKTRRGARKPRIMLENRKLYIINKYLVNKPLPAAPTCILDAKYQIKQAKYQKSKYTKP